MIAMTFVLLALAAFQDELKWQPVTQAGGAFSVELPGDQSDELRSQPVPMIGPEVPFLGGERAILREVIRNTNHKCYLVCWIKVPGGIRDQDKAQWLAAARENVTRIYLRTKVVTEKDVRLGEVFGRDFTVTQDVEVGPHMSWGRSYIRGDTIYSLAAVAITKDTSPPPDVVRFLDSFAFAGEPLPAGKVGQAQDEAAKDEMKRMEGEWRAVSVTGDGKPWPEVQVMAIRIVIKADGTWVEEAGKEKFDGTVTIDPEKTPKTANFVIRSGKSNGTTSLEIYEIDGDMMRLCFVSVPHGQRIEQGATDKVRVRGRIGSLSVHV